MANVKISLLPSQTDILQVDGLAGYDSSGTIKINGTDLKNSLLSPTSGNLQIRPQAGTLVLGLQGQNIDINGNTQINGSLSLNVDSNTYGVIGTSTFTSVSFDGTAASTSTGYAVRLSGPVADSINAVGTSGQVLSSTGSGTQWVAAGGSTPDIQTVVNAGANSVINDLGTNRSYIDFREGNTTAQFTVGKDPGGNFGIKVGQGSFVLQGAVTQSILLQAGSSPTKSLSLTDSNSGNAVAELTSGMDLRLSSSSAFKCGGSASPGTSGQVLTSTGTSVEWTTYGLEQVLQTSSAAGTGQSITFTDGTNINVLSVTGFDSASTATLEVKSSGANVEVNSVNNDVILKGGGDLVLENTGLGTPVSGDYLVADGVTGKAQWQTDPKAFVTLTGSPTWIIRNGYNATWNIAAGSETLSITADDGDSGTLVVINAGGEITWPANSNWPDATEPTLTATGTDVFSFIYDGTNYYWSFGQNFGA